LVGIVLESPIIVGVFLYLVVLSSIHEFAHAIAVKRVGGSVLAIRIMSLYGLTTYDNAQNVWVPLAGPLASLGLAAGLASVALTGIGDTVLVSIMAALALSDGIGNLVPVAGTDGYAAVRYLSNR
jgi:Zn-dependent protease